MKEFLKFLGILLAVFLIVPIFVRLMAWEILWLGFKAAACQ